MNAVNPILADKAEQIKLRRAAQSDQATIFTDIYREDTNITIWQRQLSLSIQKAVNEFLTSNRKFQAAVTITPSNAITSVSETIGNAHVELSENIAELVDMFCCLFELKRVGLRLAILEHAMCPRFHVDKVPCRLVTTYQGAATQWLPHNVVDRTKLGTGNNGLADENSGLIKNTQDIHQLKSGEVALLKGESWQGNEGAGLVHRSPALLTNERRILLTLDFCG